jgi:hypothetical protein
LVSAAAMVVHFMVPRQAHLASNFAYGTANIGKNDEATALDVSVSFPAGQFTKPPSTVLCTMRKGPDTSKEDIFNVTILSITADKFRARVIRVDQFALASWGQDLLMDWFAIAAD